MTAVQNALYDVIAGLAGVTGWVTIYRGQPAIFTREIIPPQVQGNYVVIEDALSDIPGVADTKTTRGRLVVHDIGFYKIEDGDPSDVQDVAELVRDTLHRNPIPVTGYGNTLITKAFGPVSADDNQVYGRIVTVSLDMAKAQ